MGLLEKLRPQPKWKHADPAVRLDAVRDMDGAEQDELARLAKDDPDSRVRRGAVARVLDAAALGDIVRNDSDPQVRDAALDRLVERSGSQEPEVAFKAVAALASLGRMRELASLARSAGVETTRHLALEQVGDQKALGSVARHAADASTRLLAIVKVSDADELEAVALRSEHADAALAALERLSSPTVDVLGGIAQRAKSRAAQKRARALLRAQEQAAVQVIQPMTEYRDADQARARALGDQMAALATVSDGGGIRATYAGVRVAWVELLADADVQPDIVAGFEQMSDVVRGRLAAEEAARAEAAREAEALTREQAGRAALCAQVESLNGDDAAERLEESRAAWAQLTPMPEEWGADLQRRFDEACRAAERRLERWVRLRDQAATLPEFISTIEALAETSDYAHARAQWQTLRRQWHGFEQEIEIDPLLRERYERASTRLEAHEQESREQKVRQQQENLQRLHALVQRLETRGSAEQLSLREAEQILKDAKMVAGTMGPLPEKQDREDLTVRLQAVRAAVQPRLQEMREAEEWKRWANVQVQEELCAKMEALSATAEAEPERAATEMRGLQERWKQVAAAPRSQAEVLWTRFKAAQDQVYEKSKDFFAKQAVERQENLAKKEGLCERAEGLVDSTDWVRTADTIKALQAEWKAIGPVSRGHEKAVWERFRAACDRFFTRRQEDLKQRKQEWSDNLAKKEALVAEAEALAASTEWERAAARIKQLQVEWRKIGAVRKTKSEMIWQRFRAACDLFFERFKTRDQAAVVGKVADRETAIAELEGLIPPADASPDLSMPEDLYAKVQAARARFLQGPELPRHALAPLADRVNDALLTLAARWPEGFRGTELDPDLTRRKMEKLVTKVEALLPAESAEGTGELSPAELLARQWREALAANTMGAAAGRQADEARQRVSEQEVRSAQVAWSRLGPLALADRRPLQDRFERAVKRFFEQKRRQMVRA